jgi:O-glycosyl hydrolase
MRKAWSKTGVNRKKTELRISIKNALKYQPELKLWASTWSPPTWMKYNIYRRYPDLKLYQTEQECGDGKNDWKYCRYTWTLLKRFLENGVSAYHYWNIALKEGGGDGRRTL